jgi:tetratricopeptide (TPR) repeat protein
MEALDRREAKRKQEESAAICRVLGDKQGIADATLWLSWAYAYEGDVEKSVPLAQEGLSILRDLGGGGSIAWGLTALTSALAWAGEYAESQAQMEECLAIHDDLGTRSGFDWVWLGWVHMHQGRYAKARSCLETGMALGQALGRLQHVADARNQLGHLAVPEGRHQEATDLILESITMYQTLGLAENMGVARCALGYAARGQGDLEQAQQLWVQALQLSTEKGSFPLLVYSLPGTALVLLDRGELEWAVETYELACRFGAVANSCWFEDVAGKHIAAAAKALPADVVRAAQERGQARDLDATVKELLAELEAEMQDEDRMATAASNALTDGG